MKLTKHLLMMEHLIYLVFWLMLFLVPVVGFWLGRDHFMGQSDMMPLYGALLLLFVFFLLFVLNFYVLMPRLFYRRRVVWYVVSVMVACVVTVSIGQRIENAYNHSDDFFEQRQKSGSNRMSPPPMPPNFNFPPAESQHRPPHGGPKLDVDMLFHIPNANLTLFILALLVVCFNLSISLVFKTIEKDMEHKILDKERVTSELEYLKYQINPHFLMNTLNNIHALVDIDSEKAKETIINLSKMMRFVLYKGPKDKVSLLDEIEFLKDYIELMRIRYIDSVDIRFEYPENIPTINIPSLLFVPFVENAFKHGVSYQKNSFIHIAISGDEKNVNFEVVNSKIDETMVKEGSGGIGLDNTKRRLNLIYGTDYTLDIDDDKDSYKVNLKIKAL